MARPPHVAVIYDAVKFIPLKIFVNEDHEDGEHMFTIRPEPGEDIAIVPKDEVRGLSLNEIARIAILKKTGRNI